jgi:hypothetical protein
MKICENVYGTEKARLLTGRMKTRNRRAMMYMRMPMATMMRDLDSVQLVCHEQCESCTHQKYRVSLRLKRHTVRPISCTASWVATVVIAA